MQLTRPRITPDGSCGRSLSSGLRDQSLHTIVRDIWNDEILGNGDANVAVAIGLGQAGHIEQLIRRNSPDGNKKACVVQPDLSLLDDAEVIRGLVSSRIGRSRRQRPAKPVLKLAPESLDPPVLDQECEARTASRDPRSVIAEEQRDVLAELCGSVQRHECIERCGEPVSARSHLSAHGNVEPPCLATIVPLNRRGQRDVLGFSVDAVLETPGDGHVELARKVGELPVSQEHRRELVHNRRCVEQLVRREPCHRTTHDIADVVHARLN